MISTTLNYVAILVAAMAAFAVGALWHGPLFGKMWMHLIGFKLQDMKKMKVSPKKSMTLGFISLLVVAFVMANLVQLVGATTLTGALVLTAFLWLGISAPLLLGGYLWENKSFALFCFSATYRFIELLIIVAIVTMWV